VLLLRPRVARFVVSVLCTFPAIDLVRALYQYNKNFVRDHDFKAFMFAIRMSGYWAFAFLFLALACTPVQRWAKSAWIPAVRRPLGLAAFGYCLLHLWAYVVVGQKMQLEFVIYDSWHQVSRIPGWLSLLLLVPLAVTSTDGMAKRLGGKRWKLLHRLVYPSAALAVYHAYLVEADHYTDYPVTKTTLIIFVGLMLGRLIYIKRKSSTPPPVA
jgi:methionine sulfoxide reductase heme-binding subunit